MALVSSLKSRMKTAASVLALTVLAGCSGVSMPPQNTMNLYGADTPEGQRSRVDRLVRYCERVSNAGDYALAMGLCTRAHDLDPTNPLPLAMLAENFKATGDNENAATAYQKILEIHPENADTYYLLSKHYMDMGDTDRAMSTLIAALEVAPNDPRFHNVIGVLHDKQGNHQMAQFHYREAMALDPTNNSVASNLGLSLVLTGDRDEAIALLNRVVTDPDADQVSHYNLALAYASIAKVETAAAQPVSPIVMKSKETGTAEIDIDDRAPLVAPTAGPITEAPLSGTPLSAAPAPRTPGESQSYVPTPAETPLDEPRRAPADRTAEQPTATLFNREVVDEVSRNTVQVAASTGPENGRPVSLLDGAMAAHNDGVWDVAEEAEWDRPPALSNELPWTSRSLSRTLHAGR